MTVIVWDGKTLATDCAATDGAAKWRTQKAWRWADEVLSGAGPLQTILQMRDWYMGGALENKFPAAQLTPQFCHFVVLKPNVGLVRYERGLIPVEHGYGKCAFGEGKDFAYGAMAMGAGAETAVIITNEHSVHCGLGVMTYEV